MTSRGVPAISSPSQHRSRGYALEEARMIAGSRRPDSSPFTITWELVIALPVGDEASGA